MRLWRYDHCRFYAGLNQGCISGIGYLSPGDFRFKMYPNPSVDRLTIITDNTKFNSVLIIRDISGRVIYDTQLTVAGTQIGTEILPNGLYFVSISNGSQTDIQKLLIQH